MVNFVECFRQIDCTEVDRVTFAHIVANNITYSIYSISATHTFLKAELITWRFKIWLVFFKETVFKYFRQEWTYGDTTKVVTFESFGAKVDLTINLKWRMVAVYSAWTSSAAIRDSYCETSKRGEKISAIIADC